MPEITVKITKVKSRKFWSMYFDDPLSGKRVTRSTKATSERDARKAAGKWEAELREGRYKPKSNVTWDEFRERFEAERLTDSPKNTRNNYVSSLNAVERYCKLNRLSDLTTQRIDFIAESLRKDGASKATVGTYLRHVRAALRWASKREMLVKLPEFNLPEGSSGKMKGRPITVEEFERMLEKVEVVLAKPSRGITRKKPTTRKRSEQVKARELERLQWIAANEAPEWKRLLRGLWLSGLRLAEALQLSWDDDEKPLVDLSGRRPMLRIPASCQKGKRDTVTAIPPDLFAFLCETPQDQRTGRVFNLPNRDGSLSGTERGGLMNDENTVGRVISEIGKAANVVVDKAAGKFASAHDLRRSYGDRWKYKLTPAVLKEQMRHRSIETTMKFYAGSNAEATADVLWAEIDRMNKNVDSSKKPADENEISKSQDFRE